MTLSSKQTHKDAILTDLRDEDDMVLTSRVDHIGIGYNTNLVSKDQVPTTRDEFRT